ncbi:hypothetical protein PABG_05113 [Paracoccidioides brasiliensis Pb03]|nr:hypothetical protein PABG_05113 [Paracoccidioides brasiliensis Pb03]
MSSPIATLASGVEIELLLKPKEDKNRITAVPIVILAFLCSGSVESKLNTGTYENWTVADEPALDERPGFCSENNGRREITMVFDAMTQNFDVELNHRVRPRTYTSPQTGT